MFTSRSLFLGMAFVGLLISHLALAQEQKPLQAVIVKGRAPKAELEIGYNNSSAFVKSVLSTKGFQVTEADLRNPEQKLEKTFSDLGTLIDPNSQLVIYVKTMAVRNSAGDLILESTTTSNKARKIPATQLLSWIGLYIPPTVEVIIFMDTISGHTLVRSAFNPAITTIVSAADEGADCWTESKNYVGCQDKAKAYSPSSATDSVVMSVFTKEFFGALYHESFIDRAFALSSEKQTREATARVPVLDIELWSEQISNSPRIYVRHQGYRPKIGFPYFEFNGPRGISFAEIDLVPKGDPTFDGVIDDADLNFGHEVVWQFRPMTPAQTYALDVNSDGVVNLKDLLNMLERSKKGARPETVRFDKNGQVPVVESELLNRFHTSSVVEALKEFASELRGSSPKSLAQNVGLFEATVRNAIKYALLNEEEQKQAQALLDEMLKLKNDFPSK